MPQFYDLPPVTYDTPEPDSREAEILDWCNAALSRGQKFVEASVGYDKIESAQRALFAYEGASTASYAPMGSKKLSQTRVNAVAKIAEDLTAMLTDTRYFWNYTTQNPKYAKQAENANKQAEAWYINRQIDLRIGDVIRYWTFAGTGVLHHYYSRRINDMMVEAEDPRHVFPIDPISYHTFQDCKGVIVRRARTPDWVKEEFDKDVRPDVGGSGGGFFGWIQRTIEGPGERGGPLTKQNKSDKPIPATPTVYVNTMYLKDSRTNDTGKPVRMGPWKESVTNPGEFRPTSPWSYEVAPDAPLYPFNRLLVWGGGVLLHDGPAPYWHAKFPLIKFTLNPWPGAWLGKAPLWDCLPLEESVNRKLRVVDDHCEQVANPGIVADRNVSKAEVQKADTRAPGMKIRTNMASGKGIQIVNPPPLDAMIMQSIQWSLEMMQKQSGTVDPSSMASLAQIPSDDTIDALFKAMTPGIRLRSRILEGCYKDLAEMQLYGMMEWDSITKRVAMLGPSAVTHEDFDYDAHTQIPDDVPDGSTGDIASTAEAFGLQNPRPLYARCRAMLQSFVCQFDPSSLLNSAHQQELLQWFMLSKMGFCSVFTLFEKMGKLAMFAPPGMTIPPDEIGRLALQQQLGIGMIANAQGRKSTDAAPPSMGQNANGPIIQTS